MNRTYICIDLKSFYASVECVDRGLEPLIDNLVVADDTRTDKTICLAVTPSLKAQGVPSRPRLFEVKQKVREINKERRNKAFNHSFIARSYNSKELEANPNLKLAYIIARPRMAHYIEVSSKIYSIYLKYIAKEDIHVYSIDEVFIDATNYLNAYGKTAYELAKVMIKDVLNQTGITATAGIGTNMYLAKVAMDIVAKRSRADKDGVRVASLDEISYRKELWEHTPLTDFWRIGHGIEQRLNKLGIYTMGDIALYSMNYNKYENEDVLFKEFGINAELIIDHAWGIEPALISDIKAYKPKSSSLSQGQVLCEGYSFDKARIVIKEMADALSLDLVEKGLLTNQLSLMLGYDRLCLNDAIIKECYKDMLDNDYTGRIGIKPSNRSINLEYFTSSSMEITKAIDDLYQLIADRRLKIKRINISANNLIDKASYNPKQDLKQVSLFDDLDQELSNEAKRNEMVEKEYKLQKTISRVKGKYGRNALIKGMSLEDGATAKERNEQIGGHRS